MSNRRKLTDVSGTICPYQQESDVAVDQPSTNKKSKGRFLCKHKTLSLARLHHSCKHTALLEMVNNALKLKQECAYANGILLWQKGLTMQTRRYCYWWEIIPSGMAVEASHPISIPCLGLWSDLSTIKASI